MGIKSTSGLMKIGELAKAAGISVTTAKFYVKEGLIQSYCKTGRNMAYYHPDCVSQIGVIKTLQREKFYPLNVIKRLLETPSLSANGLDLLNAINKIDNKSGGNPVPMAEAAKIMRLSTRHIATLVKEGLITPLTDGHKHEFSEMDMNVMSLVRKRMDAGIPFEQSVRAFIIYERALREAAQADVDSFIAGALMVQNPSAEDSARMIRVSDETLDMFVETKRKQFNREYGSRRVEDLDRFETSLKIALNAISDAFATVGKQEEAAICANLANGGICSAPLTETFRMYLSFVRGAAGDIAKSIVLGVRSREYFTSLKPSGVDGFTLIASCMRLCWLALAPAVLQCERQAGDAAADFHALTRNCLGDDGEKFEKMVRVTIIRLGGML